jgi:hypothetical protein
MTTAKATRSLEIAKIIEIVAKYFSVDPHKVLTSFAPKNQSVARARILVWYHLHRSGLSFAAIARIFGKLSPDNVARRVKYGVLSLSGEDQMMLATLPKLTTSVEISKAS